MQDDVGLLLAREFAKFVQIGDIRLISIGARRVSADAGAGAFQPPPQGPRQPTATAGDEGAHAQARPRARPMISFMISFVPP